jgi:hypothetical protein
VNRERTHAPTLHPSCQHTCTTSALLARKARAQDRTSKLASAGACLCSKRNVSRSRSEHIHQRCKPGGKVMCARQDGGPAPVIPMWHSLNKVLRHITSRNLLGRHGPSLDPDVVHEVGTCFSWPPPRSGTRPQSSCGEHARVRCGQQAGCRGGRAAGGVIPQVYRSEWSVHKQVISKRHG